MQTTSFQVAGMTCGACVGRVTNALRSIDGVGKVNVSLADAIANVEFDQQVTAPAELQAAVRVAGYEANAVRAAPSRAGNACCCR